MNPTAQEILDSTAWKGARDKLLDQITEAWRATDPKDTDALTDLSYRQRAVRDIIFGLEREFRARNLQKT